MRISDLFCISYRFFIFIPDPTEYTEMSYKCTRCEKSFLQKCHLLRHSERHDNVRYHCVICQKSYTQMDHLKTHIREVHGGNKRELVCQAEYTEMLYKCNRCDKTYTLKSFKKTSRCSISL